MERTRSNPVVGGFEGKARLVRSGAVRAMLALEVNVLELAGSVTEEDADGC